VYTKHVEMCVVYSKEYLCTHRIRALTWLY